MVTAEFAVVLPAVVLVLGVALAGLMSVVDEVRCIDAARTAVRSASRGDAAAAVVATGTGLAPAGSTVEIVAAGPGEVTVRVEAPDRPWLTGFPDALRPRAEATMPLEVADESSAIASAVGPGDAAPAGAPGRDR